MYEIKLNKKVVKFIESRTKAEKKAIKEKFELLMENPYPPHPSADLKKMQGTTTFRLRIGKYRFIYEVVEDERIIYVEKSGSRGDVYK